MVYFLPFRCGAINNRSTKRAETVPTEPATPPVEEQPTTPEQTPPATSTEVPAREAATPPATDDRGNPADGSPVFEITFNIPQAEYVGYDADRVARLAVEKCKAAGMMVFCIRY